MSENVEAAAATSAVEPLPAVDLVPNVEPVRAAEPVPAGADAGWARGGAGRFLRHFVEMLVAMVAGMMLLGMLQQLVPDRFLPSDVFDRPDVAALVMATDMTVGMAAWMAYRRHRWPVIAEMGAAMYLPFLLFLPPYWLGAVSGEVVMIAGHLLMVPAMLLAMLRRRDEYTGRCA